MPEESTSVIYGEIEKMDGAALIPSVIEEELSVMAGNSRMVRKESSIEKTESEKLFGFKERPFGWDD